MGHSAGDRWAGQYLVEDRPTGQTSYFTTADLPYPTGWPQDHGRVPSISGTVYLPPASQIPERTPYPVSSTQPGPDNSSAAGYQPLSGFAPSWNPDPLSTTMQQPPCFTGQQPQADNDWQEPDRDDMDFADYETIVNRILKRDK